MRTVRAALAQAERRLRAAGIETADLDARVLLRSLLNLSAAALYPRLDCDLDAATSRAYADQVDRRAAGEPVAYLTGHREFYGLDFLVSPAVLIPRPETELLVERAVALLPPAARVVDVGIGSGAIGVAVAQHRPDVTVIGVDASLAACRIAYRNTGRLGLDDRVGVVCGDLLSALRGPIDSVLANLPYLDARDVATLTAEVRREPRRALDGGADGLDLYRRLLPDLRGRDLWPTVVLCEIAPHQGAAMLELAASALPGYQLAIRLDLAGRVRVLEATLPVSDWPAAPGRDEDQPTSGTPSQTSPDAARR